MSYDRDCKILLGFNVVCLCGYSGILAIGCMGNFEKLNITKNTLFVTYLFSLLQFVIGSIQCNILSVKDKSNNLRKTISNFGSKLVLFLFCIIIIYLIAIFYGAPIYESSQETLGFSILFTTFSMLTSIMMFGKSWSHWFLIVFSAGSNGDLISRSIMVTFLSTMVGGWLGAFPIPLDWDRPWQIWPISCVLGTMFGHCIGLVLSSLLIYLNVRYSQTSAKNQKSKSKRV